MNVPVGSSSSFESGCPGMIATECMADGFNVRVFNRERPLTGTTVQHSIEAEMTVEKCAIASVGRRESERHFGIICSDAAI